MKVTTGACWPGGTHAAAGMDGAFINGSSFRGGRCRQKARRGAIRPNPRVLNLATRRLSDLLRHGPAGPVHPGSSLVVAFAPCHRKRKKSRRGQTPKAFDHVGLLINGLPGTAGSPFA
jgi:hypothetical protein